MKRRKYRKQISEAEWKVLVEQDREEFCKKMRIKTKREPVVFEVSYTSSLGYGEFSFPQRPKRELPS